MRTRFLLCFIALPISVFVSGQVNVDVQENVESLIGNWEIDLRPTPNAEAYYQTFEVLEIVDNAITGTFYGSQITNGLINENWDRLYFAFTTSDQSNDYYHSGYLQNGKIYGISYCPNRKFTAPWTGALKK